MTRNQRQETSLPCEALRAKQGARPFIIPIFLPHAGCPHQCVFCNQVAITGAKHAAVEPHKIRIQIREFLNYKKENRKPVQIAFFGGNFLGLKLEDIKSCLKLAGEFVDQGLVDGIRFSTRPDTIDAARLDILENYPISTVELGVQSMDDQVLALAERGHGAADTIRAVKALKERQLGVGLQMMVGLPGDSEAKALSTARKIADLHPDCVRIYPTVVVANSRLAQWFKNGEYLPLSLEEAVGLVKKVYLLFKQEGIAVIRMGLQATDDLADRTTVLAGPQHPAFGHLVYSQIFFDAATTALKSTNTSADCVTLGVNPRSVSKLRGYKSSNIEKLKMLFDLRCIEIQPDVEIDENSIKINNSPPGAVYALAVNQLQ
ncbi:MAG: radical SAM protein [Desulfobacteraceae bacterium]|nr:radical SAM protein [Desulfobacteraceae bacterium]